MDHRPQLEQPQPQPQPLPLPLAALERDVAALCEAWAGSLPAMMGVIGGGAQAEVEQMSDSGLVKVTDALAIVRRDVDVMLARVAAEVTKRSGREFGDVGLAKAQGFHNPVRLIAASTGASRSDAAKLIAVGAATAQRQTFSGERLPPRHPYPCMPTPAMPSSLMPGSNSKRFRTEFFIQASNILNHANQVGFSGVQTSPFFGQATAALPGRRIETGTRFSF